MNIIITGINGFVGSNMYHRFNKENGIYGIDISQDKHKDRSEYYSWNNLAQLPEVEAIIHLAGMAHDTKGTVDDAKYYEINVGLTKKIFEHYLNSSARKFIYFSSVKAVSDSVTGESLTENFKPNPITPYGKSKLAAEEYLLSQYLPANKKLFILRPGMIHGPGNKGNLNLLYSIVKRGIPYPLGAFINNRSFTSIENIHFIITSLLTCNIESGTYNICDDEPLSTTEIVEMIYQSMGKKSRIINVPQKIIQKVAAVGDILGLPLNSERLLKLTESYIVSNEKIKKALSVRSLPTTSKVGMAHTIESFKGQL